MGIVNDTLLEGECQALELVFRDAMRHGPEMVKFCKAHFWNRYDGWKSWLKEPIPGDILKAFTGL